ncbi:MAG: translation initiation factor IF-2 [Candidatus Melainabacteria bacterium]|nr:translation initiation factor IF-2 [Candidatus Melainabacteria bacterium]
MEERVRVYELAKKMNISNQEVITALRELGYDVKSHSSTVDGNAIKPLIEQIKKKASVEALAETQKAAAKGPVKAKGGGIPQAKIAPPPPEKKVEAKPRVLARYKKPTSPDGALEPVLPEGQSQDKGADHGHGGSQSPNTSVAASVAGAAATQGGPSPLPASQISSSPRVPRRLGPDGEPISVSSPAAAAAASTQSVSVASAPAATAPATGAPQVTPSRTAQSTGSVSVQNPLVSEKAAPAVDARTETRVDARPLEDRQLDNKRIEEVEENKDDTDLIPLPDPKSTGDSWSEESKFAPNKIRNLDNVFQKKQREERALLEKDKPKPAEEPARAKEEFTNLEELTKFARSTQPDAKSSGSPVPIRVAAPSMRATPPRPPKSHRQSQSNKPKREDEREKPESPVSDVPKFVTLTGNLTVQELAERMNIQPADVIKHMFMKGIMRTVNQLIEFELAKEIATEMEYEISTEEVKPVEDSKAQARAAAKAKAKAAAEENGELTTRPPVVTIMGHVDHGKTSLLDAIRQVKIKVVEGEAGGITQHIGAYHVEVESEDGVRQIVFLDTPGHEAFTAMRARGAKATDIAILVVAADDGVMPQTIEAIDHAKAANVPIIVAVNKIDKPGSDPDRVLSQLMEHDLLPDTFGGDTVTVNVSAKKRTGLDELLEMILLVADMQDLRANLDIPAYGVIVEAELSRGKGAVATALVQNGTLREGDLIVVGSTSGRVRALFDDRGHRVKAAGPSMPVEVLGLDQVPQAGDPFEVVDSIQEMKEIADTRKDAVVARQGHHVSLESLHEMLESGEMKELKIIVKADVQGTAEAIADSVRKLSDEKVQITLLRAASGEISENDVNLAASSNAIIIGFNSNPDQNARQVAEAAGVDIRIYNVIYQITDDIQKAMLGMLEPIREEVKIGTAEIRKIFKVGKGSVIAGCMVQEGKIQRNAIVRVERNGEQIYEGKLDNLKRFKDDVKEVAQGFECGMSFEKFGELEEGDKVHAFIIKETKLI